MQWSFSSEIFSILASGEAFCGCFYTHIKVRLKTVGGLYERKLWWQPGDFSSGFLKRKILKLIFWDLLPSVEFLYLLQSAKKPPQQSSYFWMVLSLCNYCQTNCNSLSAICFYYFLLCISILPHILISHYSVCTLG